MIYIFFLHLSHFGNRIVKLGRNIIDFTLSFDLLLLSFDLPFLHFSHCLHASYRTFRYERIQKFALKAEDTEADPAETQRSGAPSSKGHRGGSRQASEGQVDKKKRGRPRKSSQAEVVSHGKQSGDLTDGEFSGFDELVNRRKNRAAPSRPHRQKGEFMAYARQHLEAFMQENPDMTDEVALTKLRWRWRKLNNGQGGRYKGAGGKRKHQRAEELSNEWEEEEGSSGGGSAKRQRLEEDGGRGVYKVVRNEKVCCRCESVSARAGADMVRCKGLCCGVFHLGCLGLASMPRRDFKCEECLTERHPCFICKSSAAPVQRCTVSFCGKFYHDACIQRWPQVFRQRQQEVGVGGTFTHSGVHLKCSDSCF